MEEIEQTCLFWDKYKKCIGLDQCFSYQQIKKKNNNSIVTNLLLYRIQQLLLLKLTNKLISQHYNIVKRSIQIEGIKSYYYEECKDSYLFLLGYCSKRHNPQQIVQMEWPLNVLKLLFLYKDENGGGELNWYE